MPRHQTKDKGDLAVAKALAGLRRAGIMTCLPLSEHLPFDLVAVLPDMVTLRRVQVKYRAANRYGAIELSFRSNYYDSKRIYSKPVDLDSIDCYAIYSPEMDKVYYLRTDEIPENAKTVSLRIEPSRTKQTAGIRMASDYVDPRRIGASSDLAVPLKPRELSPQDDLARAYVIADLLEQQRQPLIAGSQFLPFDLVAVESDMKTLSRVRVGWETVQRTAWVDSYACYMPQTGKIMYIDASDIGAHPTRTRRANTG